MAYHILWADDEIDLLKPHVIFLQNKGFDVSTVFNGNDALDFCKANPIDLLFLDENMPGLSGLETLERVKQIQPNLPVVMITKSDEERISEQAIGSQITDYLLKPLNPNQILISVKKILDNKRLISEKTKMDYQQEFRNISMQIADANTVNEWIEIYKKLVYWELQLESSGEVNLKEILASQKEEANHSFSSFVIEQYESWLNDPKSEKPVLSHQLLRKKVFPKVEQGRNTFLIVIDNLRYDQWLVISPLISQFFKIEEESIYCSILPTTTAYARNALFAGMMPSEIAKTHADLWVNDEDEEGQNMHEEELLLGNLKKNKLDLKTSYHKVIHQNQGKQLVDQLSKLMGNQFVACVFNFVDMLSHARTDRAMIRELAADEAAYRSLTKSWFEHSPLFDLLKALSETKSKVFITTDHGTVFVTKPHKIVGDKESTNDNLRYKQGRNLSTDEKKIFFTRKPENLFLPKRNISTSYAFCVGDLFFAYPNNFNHYVTYYKDTFQHGGISLEEMLIPFVSLTAK